MPIFPPDPEPAGVALEDRIRVGVLGLEGTHRAGGVMLNSPREDGYPRYKLNTIGGIHSLGERDEQSASRFGQIGERAYPTLLRGKTLTYEGVVQALTLESLRTASDTLRWAFGDARFPLDVAVMPHPANPLGLPMSYRAKVMTLELEEEVTRDAHAIPSPWQRDFTLSLRQLDPRYFDLAELEATGESSVTVDNPGSAPTDPVLEVAGPGTDPWTVAYEDGRFLTFSGADEAASFGPLTVVIDFAARTARLQGTIEDTTFDSDFTGYVTPDSTWWNEGVYAIDPRSSGAVTLTGAAGLTVRWRPAHF